MFPPKSPCTMRYNPAHTKAARCQEADASSCLTPPLPFVHQLKRAQRHLEFLEIQESYIKDEMKNLKREMIRAKEEVRQIQSVPLVIGQFIEMVNLHYGIVTPTRCRVLARVCACLFPVPLTPQSAPVCGGSFLQ